MSSTFYQDKNLSTPLAFQKRSSPPQRVHPQPTLASRRSMRNNESMMAFNEVEESDYDFNISQDLLLSEKVLTHKRVAEVSRCPTHFKNQDIICVVERVRVCPHCALFGTHKDHIFKSQAQLLQQLLQQQSKLNELSISQKRLRNDSLSDLWRRLECDCRAKQKQLLDKLNTEYTKLIKRIELARRDIQASITERTQAILQTIHQEQQSEKWARPTFTEWAEQGRQVIADLMEQFDTPDFGKCYGFFDAFDWTQGQVIVGTYKQKIESIKSAITKAIDQMKVNLTQSINSLCPSNLFNSQVQVASEVNPSVTSLEDLDQHFSIARVQSKEELVVDVKKARHSECLQIIHEPMRTSLAFTNKQQRMSAQNFIKKPNISQSKKKENVLQSPSMTTNNTLTRKTSKSTLQTSILGKPKMKLITSPKLCDKPYDAMGVVGEYERDESMRCLNLSECNLSQDSLVYFLEKATKARPLLEINLEKNNIGCAKLIKILPYLAHCTKINLSYCGLSQACLDTLLRGKALKRLQEVVLTGNDINIKKNRGKLQQLKKVGISIVY